MERLLADAEKLTGVKYDINNLNDVYEAIHAIQGELGITGTTAKEASATLSGSFAAMKGSFSNVLGNLALGEDITPSLNALAETVSVFLFNNFIPMVGNVLKALPGAVVTFIQAAAPQFVEGGKKILESIGVGLGSGSIDFSGIKSLFEKVGPAIQNAFGKIIEIVGPALERLVGSFSKLWEALQPVLSALADMLMPVLEVIGSFIGGFLSGVIAGLAGLFDILAIAVQALTPVIQAISAVFQFISPVLSWVAEKIGFLVGLFANLGVSGTSLNTILSSAWANIKNAVTVAGSGISSVISVIKSIFTNLGSAGQVLKNVLSGAWNVIKTVVGIAGNAVSTYVTSVGNTFNVLKTTGNNLRAALTTAWIMIQRAVTTAATTIGTAVGKIKGSFEGLKNINLYAAGKAIMDGFLRGLRRKYAEVQSFIGGIGTWIQNNKGPIEYDRKLLIPAGIAIMEGLNKGLQDKFKAVKSTVSVMAEEIANSFNSPVAFAGFEGIDVDDDFDPVYDYGVIDRDVRFTGGQFEDANNQTINTLVAKVDQLTEALGDSRAITIEMDGREVARGTYEYTQDYADRKTKMTNRRKGEVY